MQQQVVMVVTPVLAAVVVAVGPVLRRGAAGMVAMV
jgi:hypothetical protein